MLPSAYLRPLLNALTGLIFSVSGLLLLTLVLVFMDGSNADSSKPAPAASAAQLAGAAPAKVLPAGYQAGKTLFTNNCSACHAVTGDVVVGPGLQGVRQRTPGDNWLHNWIRNSSAVIATGDPYAAGLYTKFNRIQMTSFSQFSDQNIADILTYIDAAGTAN